MAGRLRNHRGGPPRLGKPEPGTMRRLTIGEATEVQGNPRWMVYIDFDGVPMVLKPTTKTPKSQTVYVHAGWDPVEGLEAYWSKR